MSNETHPTKAQIVELLSAWIRQRPGLEFANYGDASAYRSELRSITRDLHDARALLSFVAGRDSITAESLAAAFRNAYSGRLSLKPHASKPGAWVLDYCAGQYWPTEYRRAACAVLASAVWDWLRAQMCQPLRHRATRSFWNGIAWERESLPGLFKSECEAQAACDAANATPTPGRGSYYPDAVYPGDLSAGDYLRHQARRELGASIARRWFN